MHKRGASADGIANIAMDGTVLDTWYPHPTLAEPEQSTTVRLGAQDLTPKMLSLVRLDEDRMVEQVAVRTDIRDLSEPPSNAHDVYLRLHLLSHRLIRPHELNMDGCLDILATVVWTNKGPCLTENFEIVRTSLRSRGLIHVYCVDRLPRMVDYVVPSGVRIAEAERVRLGAYLAPGTQVLREGFVSFNSGTLGPAKIEGRLSSGVVVSEGSTVGLSSVLKSDTGDGGVRRPMSIGRNCRIGVSSGLLGLSVGDNFAVSHNLIITPETLLYFPEDDTLAPAARIAGQDNWHVTVEPRQREPVARQVQPVL